MSYIQGFVTPVPVANEQAYVEHASKAIDIFKEFGAERMVEAWGDDVPAGKLNDFHGAVDRKDDEAVLFSWVEYPDKATYEAANERMMNDPRMAEMGDMPFDGKRMIFGGFEPILEHGSPSRNGYVDGFLLPVSPANKAAYIEASEKAATVFMDHGVTRYVECWGDDVPDGKVTDFNRAAHREDGETVVFSWCEWPDKAARDAGWEKIMADERMKMTPESMPFDGKRMIYGGFRTVVDK